MKLGGILLDLDGTVYEGKSLVPGALKSLAFLNHSKIPYRFITNTTRMTKKALVKMLGDMDFSVFPKDIFTAAYATANYCKNMGYKKILLTVPDKEIEEDFSSFQLVDHNPEAVVLGDMGEKFTFDLINNLFNHLLGGAELIAMHKNRYWKSSCGYMLDVGAFVSALEFASGKYATVIGKPNPNLFVLASLEWDLSADEILVVGDDIESDVGGALNSGMRSVLVKTGKFRDENLQRYDIKPNYIIDSIADLPSILGLT